MRRATLAHLPYRIRRFDDYRDKIPDFGKASIIEIEERGSIFELRFMRVFGQHSDFSVDLYVLEENGEKLCTGERLWSGAFFTKHFEDESAFQDIENIVTIVCGQYCDRGNDRRKAIEETIRKRLCASV